MAEHYYTSNPTSEVKEKEYTQMINGVSLKFKTVSGVFSFESRIDKASELLVKNFSPLEKDPYSGNQTSNKSSVLDLGCGYGAIGLFLKALYPHLQVTLADINNRAILYTKENAEINKLKIEVIESDLYSSLINKSFDYIVTNPPIAAGKKLNTRLIQETLDHLNPGGSLWLVAFHNKGGSTLKDIMLGSFGNVTDIVKSGGIRVYKSVRQI